MSIHRDSCAKCPDIVVHGGIKGITLFKLSMLLKCSKSPMIIYYNNQKPFFMGLWGRGLSAELIECISSTFTLQTSGTMAVCHCYFLHIFPKIKSCFPGILDRLFFFFFLDEQFL